MRRRFAFDRDLGLQLLTLYLLLIIPFLIALLVFDRLIGVRIREEVQATDLSLARSISQETDLTLTKALMTVQGLATYPEVVQSDPAGMDLRVLSWRAKRASGRTDCAPTPAVPRQRARSASSSGRVGTVRSSCRR